MKIPVNAWQRPQPGGERNRGAACQCIGDFKVQFAQRTKQSVWQKRIRLNYSSKQPIQRLGGNDNRADYAKGELISNGEKMIWIPKQYEKSGRSKAVQGEDLSVEED